MDPNLFHLDWDRTFEVLAAIVVLSIFLERALALIFEQRFLVKKLEDSGWKMPIAFIVSLLVCVFWKFDAISMIVLRETTHPFGYIITAAVIAGGAKGSVKLFRDVLGWQSTAYKEYKSARVSPAPDAK
jgi:hypothetical protein